MEHTKVIVVDDQHLFAEGLKHVIEGESNGRIRIVAAAENGSEAVNLTAKLKPDVVLMDIRMPVMDGVAATRAIHERHPEIRIMILTTFDDEDLVFDALNCGANGYVLKTIEPADLILAIDAVRSGAFYVSPSVGYALADMRKHPEEPEHHKSTVARIVEKMPSLTLREAEVIEQILKARRNNDIAENLCISEKTVRNHISAIYEKLGMHNRLQLMSHVVEMGVTRDGKQ